MNFIEYLRSDWPAVLNALGEHVRISLVSVGIAIVIAVPLAILLTRHTRPARIVLAVAGVIQTIPGLVMMGIGLLLFGLGRLPAIIVLAAYGLLPILQNTYTGIHEVDSLYTEAARGIGMTGAQILLHVEMPIALPAVMSGIRMSLVYTISWATLAALIGAGGLGDFIWTGLSSYDTNQILAGAIPASLLAIAAGALLDVIQRIVTPRGLKKRKGASA